jgi:hypothetical protein
MSLNLVPHNLDRGFVLQLTSQDITQFPAISTLPSLLSQFRLRLLISRIYAFQPDSEFQRPMPRVSHMVRKQIANLPNKLFHFSWSNPCQSRSARCGAPAITDV